MKPATEDRTISSLDASQEDFAEWVGRGDNFARSRKYNEAIEAYTAASRLDPASSSVPATVGDLHALLGDDAAALERYQDSYRIEANTKARVGAALILDKYAASRQLVDDADSTDEAVLAQIFHAALATGANWAHSARSNLQELIAEFLLATPRLPLAAPPSTDNEARRAATCAWARRRLGVPSLSEHVTYHPLDASLPLFLTLQSYLAGIRPGHSGAAPARAVSLLLSFPEEFAGIAAGLRIVAPPFTQPAVATPSSQKVAQGFLSTLVAPQIERSMARLPRLQVGLIRDALGAGDVEAACAMLARPGSPLFLLWGYPGGLCFDKNGRLDAAAMLDRSAGNAGADPYLFDRDFYLQRYPAGSGRQVSLGLDPYLEYLLDGAPKWRRPHRLFNSPYYAEKVGARKGQHLFAQYLGHHDAGPTSPTPLFDAGFYLAMYPDAATSIRNGECTDALHHFMLYGVSEGKFPSSDWDPAYYIATNDDVRDSLDVSNVGPRANALAFDHFMRFGLGEGRAPSEFFDSKYYLQAYPEVEREIEEYDLLGPFEHFAWLGRKKGYRCREPLHAVATPELYAKSLYMKRCQANAFDLQTGRTLSLPQADEPYFSIIVPCKDNFPFTARVLKLLRDAIGYARSEAGFGAEVILVDDGSGDATTDAPCLIDGLRYLRRETSGGYPAACNAGAAIARGKFLIFMNNDIEFEADLLTQLRVVIDREAGEVGCFGVMVTLMTGVIQEIGSSVWADGVVRGHDRGAPVWRHDLQSPRDVDFVSGCFMCVSRAEFESLHGFSEVYAPGYYEDVDLCARVWESGRKVRVYPALRVAHFESGSFNSGRGRGAAASLTMRNRARFVEANLEFLRQKLPFADHGPLYSRRLNTGRPRCLFVEDFVPDRRRGSGYGRAEHILRQMAGVTDVQLFAANRTAGELPAYSDWFSVSYGPDPQALAMRLAQEQFDCVYICRPHNMLRYAGVLADWKRNSGGVVIYDTEAIYSVREFAERVTVESYDAMNGDPLFESMVREELRSVGEVADAIVTVNEFEGAIAARVTGRRVVTIGHACEERASPPPGLRSRAGLLFVGAFHSPAAPNFDAVRWFSRHVMPRIVEQRPDAILSIVGYASEGVDLAQFAGPNINYVGPVSDLGPSYDLARVFVAPSRVGAGIPIKVIEAVSNGLPCVVSKLLSEQLQAEGHLDAAVFGATTLDDGAEFALQCLRLMNDDGLWQETQAATFASAQSYRSRSSLTSELERLLKPA